MLIYKIFRAHEWAELAKNGATLGAPIDVTDGYIHFSTARQVRETAAKHFAGEDGLVLVACSSTDMEQNLKWEISRGGAEFPHLFRKLQLTDVLWHKPLPLFEGAHQFPDDLA